MRDKTLVNIRHSLYQKQNPVERPAETIDAISSLRPNFLTIRTKIGRFYASKVANLWSFRQNLSQEGAPLLVRGRWVSNIWRKEGKIVVAGFVCIILPAPQG